MIDHIRKWFREYVLGTVAVFPIVWLSTPELQNLLPPKAVSIGASIAGAVLLSQRLRAKRAEQTT